MDAPAGIRPPHLGYAQAVFRKYLHRQPQGFRWRYNPLKAEDKITVSVYTTLCYECANDVQEQDFPYSEEGLQQANEWIAAKFREFIEANPTRYN